MPNRVPKQWKYFAVTCFCIACACCAFVFHVRAAQIEPLGANELTALVVGQALPENIVHALTQDGVAFQPDDAYRALLKTAGADDSILDALAKAKIAPGATALTQSDRDHLQHYAVAAQKMSAKDYQGVSSEMTAILKSSLDDSDAGFVMGEGMRAQKRYPESAAIYQAILMANPTYPTARAKLASVETFFGDDGGALRDAKTALAQYKDDAEAHKALCLAYGNLNEFDAAASECQEALRLRPTYQSAELDLGNVFDDEHREDDAIAAYKKAAAWDPTDALAPYDMGLAFEHKHDLSSAVAAYRKSKELDPTRFDTRANLGSTLMSLGMASEAVIEFRELEQMYPNSEMCHLCFGNAYYGTGDFDNAEKEYRIAIQLDPTDADPHSGIANLRLAQGKYDEALDEARKAEKLDPTSTYAFKVGGRALLEQKKFAEAATELKQAEDLQPSDANLHDLYAQALLGSGDKTTAIEELKESVELDPKQVPVALRLARAYESNGDWVNAMEEYRKTAESAARVSMLQPSWRGTADDPEKAFEDAKQRFSDHIVALKAAGKSADAAALEARINAVQSNSGLSDKMNALMQSGVQALQAKKFEEAETNFKAAVVIGRQIQPPDSRLATALDYVGDNDLGKDFAAADASFEEELKLTEQIYGPGSPNTEIPLQSLGNSAMLQKNYAAAEKFYFRIVDIESKYYGESSDRVANALVSASRVYTVQQQFDKSETYLLRAEHLDESIYGPNNIGIMYPLWNLCFIYDKWNKPEKAEPCYARALGLMQKQYRDGSPQLVSALTADASQLRKLGKTADADKLEKQAAALRSATMAQGPGSSAISPLAGNN